jgi:hypothetical protein
MIYRIRYTKDIEWAAIIRPKQQIDIPDVVEHMPYRWKMHQSWLVDVDQPNVVRAIHKAYPLFEDYFYTQCINIQEIYLTQLEKDTRIESIETSLKNNGVAKLNWLTCKYSNNFVWIDSPVDGEVTKKTSIERLMEVATEYINTQSPESPGDTWLRI